MMDREFECVFNNNDCITVECFDGDNYIIIEGQHDKVPFDMAFDVETAETFILELQQELIKAKEVSNG